MITDNDRNLTGYLKYLWRYANAAEEILFILEVFLQAGIMILNRKASRMYCFFLRVLKGKKR